MQVGAASQFIVSLKLEGTLGSGVPRCARPVRVGVPPGERPHVQVWRK